MAEGRGLPGVRSTRSSTRGSPDVKVRRKPIDPLKSWANAVAKKWVSDVTLQLIKFCFGGDIGLSQTKLQSLESFQEVFSMVLEDRYKGDIDAALGRIAHVLDEVCGQQRYGGWALEDLKERGIERPSNYVERREPKLVQLYQCMAKICSRFSSQHERDIRRVYARSLQVDLNSEITKDALSLFRYLIRNQLITVDDQKEFVDKMMKANAQNLLVHLKHYRKRNNLSFSEYPEVEETRTEISSLSAGRSINSSEPKSTTTRARAEFETASEGEGKGRRTENWVLRHNDLRTPTPVTFTPDPFEENSIRESPLSITSRGPAPPMTVAAQLDQLIPPEEVNRRNNQPDERQPLIPRPRDPAEVAHPRPNNRCSRVCLIGLGVSALLLLSGLAASIFGTVEALRHQYIDREVLVYGGSVAPVESLFPYYLSNVALNQIRIHYPHNIDLFLFENSCDKLKPDDQPHYHHTFTDATEMNTTGLYLMSESYIYYQDIAAYSDQDDVFIQPYLLKGLKTVKESYEAGTLVGDYQPCDGGFPACDNHKLNASCLKRNVFHEIQEDGYYSLWFVLDNPSAVSTMTFNYTLTIVNFTILLPQPGQSPLQCSLRDEELADKCNFIFQNISSLHQPLNMNQEQCLVAHTHQLPLPPEERSIDYELSTLRLQYTNYYINWLSVSLGFACGLFVLLCLVIIIMGIMIRKRRT